MSGSYAPPKGVLFVEPFTKPLVSGQPLPLAYRYFFLSGTVTPATVYQDGFLQTPFTLGAPITADANGNFPAIYLDPSTLYRMQLYNQSAVLVLDQDPLTECLLTIEPSLLATAITTNSTTLVPTGLSFTVLAPGVYSYEIYIEVVSSAGAPNVEFTVNYSGTLQSPGVTRFEYVTGSGSINSAPLGTTATVGMSTGVRLGIWIRGSIDATTVGSLSLSWGSSSGTNTIQMNAGSCLIAQEVLNTGVLFKEPYSKPLAARTSTTVQPGSYRQFFYSGTNYGAQAPVYADAGLTKILSQIPGQQQPSCTADGDGRFNPIYLDPSIKYGMQLYAVSGTAYNLVSTLVNQIDPYVPKPYEIIPAVKEAPTIRYFGAGNTPDPGLQITLNPGVYLLESILEFIPSAASMSVTILIEIIAGSGAVASTNIAETFVMEAVTAAAHIATGTYGSALSALTLGAVGAANRIETRGTITITGGSVTLAVAWSPSAGASGNQLVLNSGSALTAKQIGPLASLARGELVSDVQLTPLNPGTNAPLANATMQFWLSRSSGSLQQPATVYKDGYLTNPYGSNTITANAQGQFPAIYLSPSLPVRVQLFDQYGSLKGDVDPYVPNGRFQGFASVPASPVDQQASNTVPTIDPYLVVSLPAAGTYRYELYAEYVLSSSSGTNPNLFFNMFLEGMGSSSELFNVLGANGGLIRDVPFLSGFGYPPAALEGVAFDAGFIFDGGAGSIGTNSAAYNYNNGQSFSITQSNSTTTPIKITGIITVNGPCTLAYVWAQNVSSAVDLILLPGSYLKVESQEPTIAQSVVTGVAPIGALTVTATPSTYSSGTELTNFTTPSFTANVSGGSGSYSYAWSLSGQSHGSGVASAPTGVTTTVALTGMTQGQTYAGTLTCNVTDSITGAQGQVTVSLTVVCTTTLTVSLSVTAGALAVAGNFTSDANFVTTLATPSGGGGGTTYAWTFTAGGTALTINSPTAASTTLSAAGMTRGNIYTGTLQCKVTDMYGSTATSTENVSVTSQDFSGTVTIGGISPNVGYANSGWNGGSTQGSISSANDNNGNAIGAVCFNTSGEFVLAIQGTFTQSYVASLTANGVTLSTSASGVLFSTNSGALGGYSQWIWPSSKFTMPWNASASGTKNVSMP